MAMLSESLDISVGLLTGQLMLDIFHLLVECLTHDCERLNLIASNRILRCL